MRWGGFFNDHLIQWCNQAFFQDKNQDQALNFKTKTLTFFQDQDQDKA